MSRYRTVDVRLWSDRRFLSLTDDGKLIWMFYLTCPQRLAIPGVIVGGEASLAEMLNWDLERYRKGYRDLTAKGLKVRSEGRVVWLSNALKYQKIAGPKAMTGMAKAWDDIPECDLKAAIWEDLKIACKRWSVLFTKLFPKVNGEDYAQLAFDGVSEGASTSGTRSGPGPRPEPGDRDTEPAARPKQDRKTRLSDDWEPARSEVNLEAERVAAERGVDLKVELQRMRNWAKGNAAKKADWEATWRNWTSNSKAPHTSNRGRGGGGDQLDHLLRLAGEQP